jgi:hypothetical protein
LLSGLQRARARRRDRTLNLAARPNLRGIGRCRGDRRFRARLSWAVRLRFVVSVTANGRMAQLWDTDVWNLGFPGRSLLGAGWPSGQQATIGLAARTKAPDGRRRA